MRIDDVIGNVRRCIQAMEGYVPGEQPSGGTYIKLNTNENPYPPSPRVLDALRAGLSGDSLKRYPDPIGTVFREAAGRVLGIDPDSILIGNGSDDIPTILTRTLVPEYYGLITSFTPSYLLYQTLAQIQGARHRLVPFGDDWMPPDVGPGGNGSLILLPNPNSPSGTFVPPDQLEKWVDRTDG